MPARASTPERQALVLVALEALTRADEARELVEREGMVVSGGKMPHAHPGLKVEKDCIAAFVRTWVALGFARPTLYTLTRPSLPGSGA